MVNYRWHKANETESSHFRLVHIENIIEKDVQGHPP